MNRRIARFDVSAQLIMDSLAMPEGSKLYNIVRHVFNPDVFVFYVEHPDLPEMIEGVPLVEIMPVITANYDKRPSTWLKFEWNVAQQRVADDGATTTQDEQPGDARPASEA